MLSPCGDWALSIWRVRPINCSFPYPHIFSRAGGLNNFKTSTLSNAHSSWCRPNSPQKTIKQSQVVSFALLLKKFTYTEIKNILSSSYKIFTYVTIPIIRRVQHKIMYIFHVNPIIRKVRNNAFHLSLSCIVCTCWRGAFYTCLRQVYCNRLAVKLSWLCIS